MKTEKVVGVVGACCLLHNYLMNDSRQSYCPDGYADAYSDEGKLIEGAWRNNLPDNSCYDQSFIPNRAGRNTDVGKELRDFVKLYVNSDVGALYWQNQRVIGTNHLQK